MRLEADLGLSGRCPQCLQCLFLSGVSLLCFALAVELLLRWDCARRPVFLGVSTHWGGLLQRSEANRLSHVWVHIRIPCLAVQNTLSLRALLGMSALAPIHGDVAGLLPQAEEHSETHFLCLNHPLFPNRIEVEERQCCRCLPEIACCAERCVVELRDVRDRKASKLDSFRFCRCRSGRL